MPNSYKNAFLGWTFRLSFGLACVVSFAQSLSTNPALDNQGLRALEEKRSQGQPLPRGSRIGQQDNTLPESREAADSSICFVIKQIDWQGASRLSQQEIDKAVSGILNQCVSTAKLNAWRTNVQKTYAKQGLIFAQVQIPPQNIQAGRLTVRIEEGKVEAVRHLNTPPSRHHQEVLEKFVDHPMNVLTLDQALEQINRMPSMQSQAQLVPGNKVGGTVIELQHTKQKPWRAQVSIDNRGPSETGRLRSVLQLEWDSLLGSNDTWFLSQINTSASRSSAMQVSAGQGFWSYGVQLSHSQYRQPPFFGLTLNGQGGSAGFWAERVLQRTPQSVWTAAASIQHSQSRRYLSGVALTPSKTTPLRFETRYVLDSDRQRLSYELAVQRGTSALRAVRDPVALPQDAAHAQYSKLSVAFGVQKGFQSALLSSRFQAQWSKEQLYPGDQMSLGGFDAVRGLAEGGLLGHRGFMIRNELIWPQAWGPSKPQPSITWDMGQVSNVGASTQSAMGAGVALKHSSSSFSWQLALAKPLHISTNATPTSDKKWRAYITASHKF